MPASEFYQWMLMEKFEPFADRRSDLLAGIVAAVIANCNRDPKHAPFSPEDFMPKWDAEPEPVQTAEQQKVIMMMLKEAMDERMKNNASN